MKIVNANFCTQKYNEYFAITFRILAFHLSRSLAAQPPPPPPPQHTPNNQEVPINVLLRQAMVKMTNVRL